MHLRAGGLGEIYIRLAKFFSCTVLYIYTPVFCTSLDEHPRLVLLDVDVTQSRDRENVPQAISDSVRNEKQQQLYS